MATKEPTLMLMKQIGTEELGWRGTEFYWPVLVIQDEVDTAVYTSELLKQINRNKFDLNSIDYGNEQIYKFYQVLVNWNLCYLLLLFKFISYVLKIKPYIKYN